MMKTIHDDVAVYQPSLPRNGLWEPFVVLSPDFNGNYPTYEGGKLNMAYITESGRHLCNSCGLTAVQISEDGKSFTEDWVEVIELMPEDEIFICEGCPDVKMLPPALP